MLVKAMPDTLWRTRPPREQLGYSTTVRDSPQNDKLATGARARQMGRRSGSGQIGLSTPALSANIGSRGTRSTACIGLPEAHGRRAGKEFWIWLSGTLID